MKVSWNRQTSGQLRLPQVCAVTGEPATSLYPTVFRNRVCHYLPRGLGRLVVSLNNPPITLGLPVCEAVRQRATTWRLLSAFGPLTGVLLGLIVSVAVGGTSGYIVFFTLLLTSLGFGIVAKIQADVVGADVQRDEISMSKAHPVFVDALARSNPPELVRIDGAPQPAYLQR